MSGALVRVALAAILAIGVAVGVHHVIETATAKVSVVFDQSVGERG